MANAKAGRLTAAALTVVLLASGCSLKSESRKTSIDPPPEQAETMMEMAMNAQAKGQAAQDTQTTLYFKDERGYVSPVSLPVANTAGIAKKSLEYLVEGNLSSTALPKGFTGLLPKGTQVKGLNIIADQKLAVVDFSKEFTDYNPQDERKILEAVTWTLTGFPSINKVSIRVEGQDLKEMPMDATPLDEPLSRAMGINLEIGPGVNPGQATPVTLYFETQTDQQFTYYVPVTRLVKRTDQVAKTTMEELIKGPSQKGLQPVMNTSAKILDVKQAGDKSLVSVDFSSQFLGDGKQASEEAVQAVVLSLTENTGAAQVQITVNGDAKFTYGQNKTYTKPVARPVHINVFKL